MINLVVVLMLFDLMVGIPDQTISGLRLAFLYVDLTLWNLDFMDSQVYT